MATSESSLRTDGIELLHLYHQNPSIKLRNKLVQRDDTEDGVTYELVGAGIPKEKIVLGFHPQNVRQHTGYAIL